LVPATVAQQCGFLGRADDINKQDSGKNAAGLGATAQRTMPDEYRFQQLFISMAAPPRPPETFFRFYTQSQIARPCAESPPKCVN
jgi:hypothetical protein